MGPPPLACVSIPLFQLHERRLRTVNALCAATRVVGEQHDGHAVCSLGANLRHAARHDAVAAVPIEQVLIVVVSLE